MNMISVEALKKIGEFESNMTSLGVSVRLSLAGINHGLRVQLKGDRVQMSRVFSWHELGVARYPTDFIEVQCTQMQEEFFTAVRENGW